MAEYALLDQAAEDALHASRLLNVEEKSFKRVSKRLLGPDSFAVTRPQLPPSPPPDAINVDGAAAARHDVLKAREDHQKSWRDDAILDFNAFESNIVRHQFLFNSNEEERARYAAEKDKIVDTAQAVRKNTAQLRVQLEETQQKLALRKTYDEQAKKITENRMLRPREDQRIALEKLHGEISDLERESADYAQTWAERRAQFGRIVEEGMQMLRLIRDEKEEAERKEGMETAEEGDEVGLNASKNSSSAVGTPGASGGAATPLHTSQSGDGTPSSKVGIAAKAEHSHGQSTQGSRAVTPLPESASAQHDVDDMEESQRQEADTKDHSTSDRGKPDAEEEADAPAEQMDTT